MKSNYLVLKKFLEIKLNRDKYNKEYSECRDEVLEVLGRVKQDGVEQDIQFKIYPAFTNKINVGNFAKDHPHKFIRMKEIEEEIKTLRDELKDIEAVMKNGYTYSDTKSGPVRWSVKVSKH